MLLVDVSGSMRAADVKPSRLGAAQNAMGAFADRVPKRVKIGLVSFSTGPDLLVIPTTDRAILHEGIDLLSPEAGTAIGDGLALAVQTVKTSVGDAPRTRTARSPARSSCSPTERRRVATLAPLQGAALARDAGIRVYTVALGTEHGSLDPGAFGLASAEAVAADSFQPALPGAAGPGDARGDRARDRRSDVPCRVGVEGERHLQGARVEHRQHSGDP